MFALVKLHCCVDEPGKWQLKAISDTSKSLRVQNAAVAVLVDLGSILPFAAPAQEFYAEGPLLLDLHSGLALAAKIRFPPFAGICTAFAG